MDFSHLNKLQVTDQNVVEYPLIEIEGEPTLTIRCASEGNKAYANAILRANGQVNGARKPGKIKVDGQLIDKMRDQDRQLYPLNIITGWEGVLDSDGKSVDFSAEACEAFLNALPNWIFDRLRQAASTPETFINTIDSEAKAGN